MKSCLTGKSYPQGEVEMRSIYDEAISLINEQIEVREEEVRESARNLARKRWGMEVREGRRPGVASQNELK
jgi:hypothetical protein